jgi:EmrB/QacA subfamily drug resistance transporter
MMASVDLTIVSTALPTIGRELGGYGVNWTSWIITMYALCRVAVTPVMGRVAELLGTRRILLVSLVVFTLASLLCGLAQNLPMLIAFRGVQALGGAAFMPSATELVADAFGDNRDRAVGLFTSVVPIGAVIGPVLGGVIVDLWSWHGVFLINVPIGVVILFFAAKLVPQVESRPPARFDVIGSTFLVAGIFCAAIAATYLGDAGHSPSDPTFVGLVVAAVIAATVLFRRSGQVGSILPAELMRGRGFGVMNLINILYGAGAIGLSALMPVFAQVRYGMSSLAAGTLLTARGVGMIAVAGITTFALRRIGYRLPMTVGYLLVATGLIALAAKPPGTITPHLWLVIATLVIGMGMGTALPAANNASMQLEPSRVASIAALRVTLRQFGSIIAVAVTTALMNRSTDPGSTEAWVFVAFAGLLVGVTTLVRLVPDHRAGW